MLFSSSATGGADGSSSGVANAASAAAGLGWPMTSFVIFAIISSACCNTMTVGDAAEMSSDKNFAPDLVLPTDFQRVR